MALRLENLIYDKGQVQEMVGRVELIGVRGLLDDT